MRVYVNEDNDQKMDIRVPTGLVLNQMTAGLAVKACQKNGVEISKNQMRTLVKVVKDYKKTHPEWKLMEAYSSDGGHIEIII